MPTLCKLRQPSSWNEPAWFDKFIEDTFGDSLNLRDGGFFDHPRGYKHVAVLQPYHADGDALLAFLTACRDHGLKVFLSGTTNYYPGSTFTIVVYRPQDQQDMMEYAHRRLNTSIEVPMGLS